MTERKATGITLTPEKIKAAAADGQKVFEAFCAREELLEKRRQAFEAFVREDGLDHEWDAEQDCYRAFACHFAWRAFNNALDSIEIELPNAYNGIRAHAIKECAQAITASGVTFKYAKTRAANPLKVKP